MPRQARLQFVSLRSSLVNLPVSLFGPLVERNIASPSFPFSPPYANQAVSYQRPQQVAVLLTATAPSPKPDGRKPSAYVGWTGMVSASSLAHFNSSSSDHSLETVEIDPQYAESLGFNKGDVVSTCFFLIPFVSYTLKVEVGLLYDLPIAKSVATEPLTPDDWEILVHMHDVPPKPIPQFIFRNCMQNT